MPTRTGRSSLSKTTSRKRRKSRTLPKRTRKKLASGRRSKYEERVIEDLEKRGFKEGKDWKYESQKLPYIIEGNYVPDIMVVDNTRYIELKGYLDYADRRKLESVKRCNPGIDLRVLFHSNSKLRRGSKMRYSDWAERVGIPWAIGQSIPKDWMK